MLPCCCFQDPSQLQQAFPLGLLGDSFVRVSIVLTKHHDEKQLGEERVYFILELLGPTPSQREVGSGAQSRNLEAKAVAEEDCSLACPS